MPTVTKSRSGQARVNGQDVRAELYEGLSESAKKRMLELHEATQEFTRIHWQGDGASPLNSTRYKIIGRRPTALGLALARLKHRITMSK